MQFVLKGYSWAGPGVYGKQPSLFSFQGCHSSKFGEKCFCMIHMILKNTKKRKGAMLTIFLKRSQFGVSHSYLIFLFIDSILQFNLTTEGVFNYNYRAVYKNLKDIKCGRCQFVCGYLCFDILGNQKKYMNVLRNFLGICLFCLYDI